MGLDAVELLMATEESFEIAISDEDAGGVVTVEDFYNLVLRHLRDKDWSRESHGCLSAHVFYKIRKALIEKLDLERKELYPKQKMGVIIPKEKRREVVDHLQNSLELKGLCLARPKWLTNILAAIAIFMLAYAIIISIPGGKGAVAFSIIIAIAPLEVFLFYVTRPLAVYFYPNDLTLGGLVKNIIKYNFAKVQKSLKQWHKKDVWDTLQNIIVEQLGVKPEEVTLSAKFYEDLGMG